MTNRGAKQRAACFFFYQTKNSRRKKEKGQDSILFFFYGVRRKDDTEKNSKVFEFVRILFEKGFFRKKAQAGCAATATRGRFFLFFTISQGTDNHRQ